LNLEAEAKKLAGSLSKMLNGTVCDGIRLSAVIRDHVAGGAAGMNIGYKISVRDQDLRTGMPLSISRKQARLYLGFFMRLQVDDTNDYMMVKDSMTLLALDADLSRELLHYDFQRDKQEEEPGYPEAHLQVCATSEHWDTLREFTNGAQLARLHLPVGPVGGRRFRPSLEDVIELLIVEGLVESRDGWQDALNVTRRPFQELQLKAAVRQYPELAAEALRKMSWKVEPPPM
jgi:hypothetical protein